MERWPEPVARVADVLRRAGVDARVEEFPEGTPTASAAAKAVGSSRAQIVKSLVFVCDGRPTLALVPGDRRADETKVAVVAGAKGARVARPDEVLAATGFEPGGVAPFPAPGISQVLISGD
ncbi:MAG TPA: YbaK/EbsC family protein, partial [Gaiellaceae bacterium]|nr:YbaK/EbsC family protein [Gaiellaceae bacterium]